MTNSIATIVKRTRPTFVPATSAVATLELVAISFSCSGPFAFRFRKPGSVIRNGSAPFLLPPCGEIGERLRVGRRVESDNGATLHPLFGDEVLESRHLGALVGEFVRQMGRD